MAIPHQGVSRATALPALLLVLVFNHGLLQVSSFNLGSIAGIGGNSIPVVSNVGNMLGIGQCDFHLGNIVKCNEEIKNFDGANPPQSSPSTLTATISSPLQSPNAADELSAPTPGSSLNDSPPRFPTDSPAGSPAFPPTESPNGFRRNSPPAVLPVSPASSPDGEEAADLTMEEGTKVIDSVANLVADKSSDSSNSTECCRAVLHVNLSCLCSFLSLKMVMALQLAEGYLGKLASMCHLDFKGC